MVDVVPQTIAKTYIRPRRRLNLLSHREIEDLRETSKADYKLFRQCALAVLNSGNMADDGEALLKKYSDFHVNLIPQSRGFKLCLHNAPSSAFVDGVLIQGLKDHVFSALRDIIYSQSELQQGVPEEQQSSAQITDAVFRILRNADVVRANVSPQLVVCWGGHSISRSEYEFTKEVGYELGLRGLDIATGCGIGAMKGPMKGAAVGHAKQQIHEGRYIGITEPGIIASEAPNALVNELVILPDIEKRLEAFVRLAHSIIVFPGGAGTAEEVLYILSILMHQNNSEQRLPLIFACKKEHAAYFEQLDEFLRTVLGEEVRQYYQIIDSGAEDVAKAVKAGVQSVHRFRRKTQESYGFNWQLHIPKALQLPFIPTHDNMAELKLLRSADSAQLCLDLRAAFSGIVAGNVKSFGIKAVAEHGPYQLNADGIIGDQLDRLLQSFVAQGRMSLAEQYKPCFSVIKQ